MPAPSNGRNKIIVYFSSRILSNGNVSKNDLKKNIKQIVISKNETTNPISPPINERRNVLKKKNFEIYLSWAPTRCRSLISSVCIESPLCVTSTIIDIPENIIITITKKEIA